LTRHTSNKEALHTFGVSKSSLYRAKAIKPSSSSALYLSYPHGVKRHKIPPIEILQIEDFWKELCPVLSGSQNVRLQFMADEDVSAYFLQYLYLIYENPAVLLALQQLKSKSKRVRHNISAAESNILVFQSISKNQEAVSFILSQPFFSSSPDISILIFGYLFGPLEPYIPISASKLFEIRDRLKIKKSTKSYYGNWNCKVCLFFSFSSSHISGFPSL
jgi:hypothetical protein